MAISHSAKAKSHGPQALSDRPSPITLRPTRPMAEALARLSADIDAPVEVVMTQAVALLMVAVEAQERGQRLCLADDDLEIISEIVGFGATNDGIDLDPFPEGGSDRLDG